VTPKTSGKAIAALICSILNFLIGPLILAIVGLILAHQAQRDIRSSGGTIGGQRVATTATVLSIVGLILDSVTVAVIVAVVLIARHG
jgi:hypothetical protein